MKYQMRIAEVQKDINRALDTLKACTVEGGGYTPQLINFLDVTIQEPVLNKALLDAKEKIAPLITDKDGTLQHFPISIDDSARIESYIKEFRNAVSKWDKQEGVLSLAHEIIYPQKYEIRSFHDTKCTRKIVDNYANKDFLKVRDLCAQQKFEEAAAILNYYNHHHNQTCKQEMVHVIYSQMYYMFNRQFAAQLKDSALKEFPHFSLPCITQEKLALRNTVVPIALKLAEQLKSNQESLHRGSRKALAWLHTTYKDALLNDTQAQNKLKNLITVLKQKTSTQYNELEHIMQDSQLGQDIVLTTLMQEQIDETALKKVIDDPVLDNEIRQALQVPNQEYEIHPYINASTQLIKAIEHIQSKVDGLLDTVIDASNSMQKEMEELKELPKILRAMPIINTQIVKRLAEIGKSINHPLESAYTIAQASKQLSISFYRLGLAESMLECMFDEDTLELRIPPSEIKAVLKEEIQAFRNAATHFNELSKADKLKVGVNLVVDQIAFSKVLNACRAAKKALGRSAHELGIIKNLPGIVKSSEELKTIEQLEKAVSQEIKAFEELEKIPLHYTNKAIINSVSKTKDVLGHIFRNAPGHVNPKSIATQQNRYLSLFEKVANNPKNLNLNILNSQAVKNGVQAYTQIFKNRKQVWVFARNGRIFDAGVNLIPK